MTLPIPLTVRLSTARADRHIERDLRSLSFRSVVPGGFASAQFSLDRPLALSADEIAYYGDVDIYDARNGNCVWCGRLEDPGRGVGADGQIMELAAVGPSAHTQDRTVSLIYVDRSHERWLRHNASTRPSILGTEEVDDTTPAIMQRFPPGMTVNTNNSAIMVYRSLYEAEQKLGMVRAVVDSGATTTDWQNRISTGVGTGAQTVRGTLTWSTSNQTLAAWIGGTNAIPNGDNVATFRMVRTGAAVPTSGSDMWTRYFNVVVRCLLYNADGTEFTTASEYGNNLHVTSSKVVNDLLGRLLPRYDGAKATVQTTSYQIEQLAYPDGVTAAAVLDDLMLLEPDYYWAAWDRNAAGLHEFEWRTWPTTVRYEAGAVDGFSSTGSSKELFNAVMVRRRAPNGFVGATRFTQAVAELDDAGLIREGVIDLADNLGAPGNVTQAANRFLDEYGAPFMAGQLTVARPIYDHDRGMSVMPWEIRPGHLIRVRGLQPSTDSLNATARDGVSVFKVVGVNYDTSSAAATLDLDSSPQTMAHLLARLEADAKKRRRR